MRTLNLRRTLRGALHALLSLLCVSALAQSQWGPWITTDWDQGGRYNDKCPYAVPYVPGVRRPVGCVATAMAQIMNYWEFPSSASFSSQLWPIGDAYVGNGISVDGDAGKYGFPTFGQLDVALESINYDDDDDGVALLSLAAGVKLQMSYGVSGSGANTHSVAAALKNGFSFGSATSRYRRSGLWADCRADVIENMRKGWPVQIAIHKSGGWGGILSLLTAIVMGTVTFM